MRKPKEIVFVCSAVVDNKLKSNIIAASTLEEANILFEKEFGIKSQTIFGPFYKKKTGILDKNFDIKFKFGQSKQGILNGWNITAMPLVNPIDSVYVLFNKRIDGQKMQKPAAMVVKESEINYEKIISK